jgi:hypothetical protein
MKNTMRLSIVIGLVLAFSFAELSTLRAATVSGDKNTASSGEKNTAPLDQQQMRGLDEQVQGVKSDVLSISQELSRLEEKLLYPSGTQVAIFVALAKGDQMRLDSVRLQIDGQLVTQHIYSAKELEALRKGGVQRIYVGNVVTGDHQLEVLVDAKLDDGKDFSRTEHLTFRKEAGGIDAVGTGFGQYFRRAGRLVIDASNTQANRTLPGRGTCLLSSRRQRNAW